MVDITDIIHCNFQDVPVPLENVCSGSFNIYNYSQQNTCVKGTGCFSDLLHNSLLFFVDQKFILYNIYYLSSNYISKSSVHPCTFQKFSLKAFQNNFIPLKNSFPLLCKTRLEYLCNFYSILYESSRYFWIYE